MLETKVRDIELKEKGGSQKLKGTRIEFGAERRERGRGTREALATQFRQAGRKGWGARPVPGPRR